MYTSLNVPMGNPTLDILKILTIVLIVTTEDLYLNNHLNRHHRESVPATKHRRPLELITYVSFSDQYQALAYEKYLKTGSGRAILYKRYTFEKLIDFHDGIYDYFIVSNRKWRKY